MGYFTNTLVPFLSENVKKKKRVTRFYQVVEEWQIYQSGAAVFIHLFVTIHFTSVKAIQL